MAIEVINGSDKHTYKAANAFDVKDGHLFVVKRTGPRSEPIAVFTPGTWQTAHEVDSYVEQVDGPTIA